MKLYIMSGKVIKVQNACKYTHDKKVKIRLVGKFISFMDIKLAYDGIKI